MGTLAGCVLAPAFQTLQKMQVIPSDLVMVLGCGPVGLGAITIAKHYGTQVLAVEISEYRKTSRVSLVPTLWWTVEEMTWSRGSSS